MLSNINVFAAYTMAYNSMQCNYNLLLAPFPTIRICYYDWLPNLLSQVNEDYHVPSFSFRTLLKTIVVVTMLEILSQSFEILLLCDLDHMNLGLICAPRA